MVKHTNTIATYFTIGKNKCINKIYTHSSKIYSSLDIINHLYIHITYDNSTRANHYQYILV